MAFRAATSPVSSLALAKPQAASPGGDAGPLQMVPVVQEPVPRPGQTHLLPALREPAFPEQQDGPKRQADVIEMFSFVQEMGIDPIKESEMLWIAEEAFYAPLPPGWSEHTDEEGRTFFHCAATGESAWQHPMDSLFREVVNYYRRIQEVGGFWTVEDELAEIEERIRGDLAEWMELFDEHGEKFYYNRQTEESRFDDPRNAVYHSLYTRIRMVAKIREHLPLLARAPRPDDPTAREVEVIQVQKREEALFLRCVVRMQAFARAVVARKAAHAKRMRRNMDRMPQPLRGQLRLRLEAVGENRDEELVLAVTTPQRQRKAAARIQARMRGVLARKRFRPKVNHRRFLESTAIVIQRVARCWLDKRRELREARRRLDHAATTLQRVQRGRQGRARFQHFDAQRQHQRARLRSSLRLQCAWRTHLAKSELRRRRHADRTARADVLQRQARTFLARSALLRLGYVRQPVVVEFQCRQRSQLQPWTWSLMMAPVQDGELCSRPPFGRADLFAAEGAGALPDLAACRLQTRARGWLARKHVRELKERLIREEEQRKRDEDLRRRAVMLIQQRFRGTRQRMMDLIEQLRAQWLEQRQPSIQLLQRAACRFAAQMSMQEAMAMEKKDAACARIQAHWRGFVARRHYAQIGEELVWPVKGWFEYTATGRDSVHVAVQFFPNPAFSSYRYFSSFGSKDELYQNLDVMEREVEDCRGKIFGPRKAGYGSHLSSLGSARTDRSQRRQPSSQAGTARHSARSEVRISGSASDVRSPSSVGAESQTPSGSARRGHALDIDDALPEELSRVSVASEHYDPSLVQEDGQPSPDPWHLSNGSVASAEVMPPAIAGLSRAASSSGLPAAEEPPFEGNKHLKGALKVLADAAAQQDSRAPAKPERRHYAGVFKDGRFHRTKVNNLEQFSEQEKQAIMADIAGERQKKVEELMRRQKRHAARQRKEQRLEAQQVLGRSKSVAAGLPRSQEKLPSVAPRMWHRHVHHHVHCHELPGGTFPSPDGALLQPLPYLPNKHPGSHEAPLSLSSSGRLAASSPGLRLSASAAELRSLSGSRHGREAFP